MKLEVALEMIDHHLEKLKKFLMNSFENLNFSLKKIVFQFHHQLKNFFSNHSMKMIEIYSNSNIDFD